MRDYLRTNEFTTWYLDGEGDDRKLWVWVNMPEDAAPGGFPLDLSLCVAQGDDAAKLWQTIFDHMPVNTT